MRYERRKGTLFKSGPTYASSYTVKAYRPGGIVEVAATSSTISLRRGHGFKVGDKILIDPGTGNTFSGTDSVVSITADTIVMGSSYTVTKGLVVFNLEADTGVSTPNYDGSTVTMYSDQEGSESTSTVTSSSSGEYSYYPSVQVLWELVRNGVSAVVEYIPLRIETTNYHVENYGARGDGSSDDSFSIQSAIDDAELAGTGTVQLGPRTYNIGQSQLLLDGSNTVLTGQGTISATTSGTTVPVSVQGSNITLQDFNVIGNQSHGTIADQATAVEFSGVSNCRMTNVTVSQAGQHGVGIWAGSSRVHATNNRINGTEYAGFHIVGASQVTISNNEIYDCCAEDTVNNKAGINVWGNATYGTSGIQISDNMVSGSYAACFRVQSVLGVNPDNVNLLGNMGYGRGANGINSEGIPITATNVTVANNVIRNAAAEGIILYAMVPNAVAQTLENINIIGNRIIDCSQWNSNHNAIDLEISGSTVKNVNVIGNIAENTTAGGGNMQRLFRVTKTGTVDISNLNVIGNTASGLGQSDGIFIQDTLSDGTVEKAIYSQGNRGANENQGVGLRTFTATALSGSVKGLHKQFTVAGQSLGKLEDGSESDTAQFYFSDGNSTFYDSTHVSGTNINLHDQTSWSPKAGDSLELLQVGSTWREVGRSTPNGLRLGTITTGATPSVEGYDVFNMSYASPETVTNFTGAYPGRKVDFVFTNAACSFQFTGDTNLRGGTALSGTTHTFADGDYASAFYVSPNWYVNTSTVSGV